MLLRSADTLLFCIKHYANLAGIRSPSGLLKQLLRATVQAIDLLQTGQTEKRMKNVGSGSEILGRNHRVCSFPVFDSLKQTNKEPSEGALSCISLMRC